MQMPTVVNQDVTRWDDFLSQHPKIEFVWLQFLSYTSASYTRMVPVAKFTQMVREAKYFAIPSSAWYLTPGGLADGASPCGIFHLRPDMSTIYRQAGSNGTRTVIQCDCLEVPDMTPLPACPRSRLRILHDNILKREMGLSILVGFEIEIVFVRAVDDGAGYSPISENNSWSCVRAEDFAHINLIEDIVRSLLDVGVPLEHFHTESAPGQWEFVLSPDSPVRAVDTLLRARDTITNIARSYGVHATLYPRIAKNRSGTGAHVHISVNDDADRTEENLKLSSEFFFAGVIQHMPSILACTLPHDISYERVQTGIFSGGEYACWGWENKDVSLRRVADNRFEFKLMDGLANPYLALAAVLSAGLDGLAKEMPLRGGHCPVAAANMDAKQMRDLGVDILLPKTLDESLAALEEDRALRDNLGDVLAEGYIAVKRKESKYLRNLSDDERRRWIIARY